MQDEEQPEPKHPRDMTSDELLDYAIAPEVAERLKELVREDDESEESED